MNSFDRAYNDLIAAACELGFPPEFGQALAAGLGGEKSLRRMSAYLRSARPTSMEEVADELVAIVDQRDSWVERKKNAYYQEKLNEFYNRERDDDEL